MSLTKQQLKLEHHIVLKYYKNFHRRNLNIKKGQFYFKSCNEINLNILFTWKNLALLYNYTEMFIQQNFIRL